ncbi:MAG TPA: M20/M25/M40 family metallo-hydrolase, partial [Candidatus Hydrogenedentes bacterium]|nr:M20/M25/M40 family metallo-hydrolase [Candidatus Hydrogenedentota bacterium]
MISRQVVWVKGVVILLAGFAGLSVYLHQPPRVVSEKASPAVFSAARAMKIVQAIAQKPHPAGSAANDAVRQEIMREIRQCGINPELQETMVCRAPGTAATVRNILARVPGTANTKAVALVAHYDSVLYGPGAADDGSGVAALIETLRALKAGPPLRNDILFIFTDGEEGVQPGKGLRGAYAFVQQHPWAHGIGLALNFDARGTAGPSYLYRASPNNGWLIRQVVAAGCPIIANSCMGAISDRMPTDSDLTAFLEAGIPGLDFAFTGNLMRYHTSLDSPGNLDPRSLQHHGEYALRLARHFGNLPLDNPEAPPAVFFNTLGTGMAVYPIAWALPMSLAVLIGLAALIGLGIRRGALGGADLVRGTAFFMGFAIAAVFGALAVVAVGYAQRGYYLIYSGDRLALALMGLAFWAFFSAVGRFRRLVSLPGLSAGVLVVWAALLMATAIGYPGAGFMFFWP